MALQDRPFPLCCAIRVLCDFGHTNTSGGSWGKVSKAKIREFLRNCIAYYDHRAMLVATLNQPQMDALGKLFIAEGFKVVAQGYNKPHPETQPTYLLVYCNPVPNLDDLVLPEEKGASDDRSL